MIAMIRADLLKLERRRGLWWTCLALPATIGGIVATLAVTGVAEIDGGAAFIEDVSQALVVFGSVLAILVGARLGSEEHAAGTIRYQLLTGAPRWQLYLSKVAVLAIATASICLSAAVPLILGALGVKAAPGDEVDLVDMVAAWWFVFVPALAYGSIAFGIGALMRQTGPAIAVALVMSLLGIRILYLLTLIDDWFRHLALDLGIDRLTIHAVDAPDDVSVGAAIVMVLAWIALALGAGFLRLRRLEA